MVKRVEELDPVHCRLKELMLSYDGFRNEVAEVRRVAGGIAAVMRGNFWTRYSHFTALFSTCRTEAQFNDAIRQWNLWLEDMRLVESVTNTGSDQE